MQLLTAHVDGPPALPQRGGLLDAALDGPTHTDGNEPIEWQLGVQCWPENTAGWRLALDGTPDLDNDDDQVDYGNQDDDIRPVAGRPVMLQTSVTGPRPSRGSSLQAVMRARLGRRLDAVTSQGIARELWTGRMTQAQPYQLAPGYDWANPSTGSGQSLRYANGFLNSSTENVIDGALTPMRALGALEAALGDRVAGGPLVIHIPLIVLNEVAWTLERATVGEGDLQREVLRTAKGSLVVADTGYPGWGPGVDESDTDSARATAWMFGSGPVQVWVGEPRFYDELHELVDVSDNSVEMWGERPFLTLFDPSTVVGVAVTPN